MLSNLVYYISYNSYISLFIIRNTYYSKSRKNRIVFSYLSVNLSITITYEVYIFYRVFVVFYPYGFVEIQLFFHRTQFYYIVELLCQFINSIGCHMYRISHNSLSMNFVGLYVYSEAVDYTRFVSYTNVFAHTKNILKMLCSLSVKSDTKP